MLQIKEQDLITAEYHKYPIFAFYCCVTNYSSAPRSSICKVISFFKELGSHYHLGLPLCIQAYPRDVVGLFPNHCKKSRYHYKASHVKFFISQMHVQVRFTLYCSLLHVHSIMPKKQCTCLNLKIVYLPTDELLNFTSETKDVLHTG